MGRRYPDCPDEKYPNGSFNPNHKKYYSGLIAQPRLIKNTIYTYHDYVDIDQVKGHPTILYEMGCRNNLKLPAYARYLKKGEFDIIVNEIIKHHTPEGETICINRKDVKWLFNKTIYGGGFSKWCEDITTGKFKDENGVVIKVREPKELINTKKPHPFYNEFYKDTHKIIDLVYLSNSCIADVICNKITEDWRRKNRVMSYFCGVIENEISFKAYKCLVDKHFIERRRCSWGYDGLTFKRCLGVEMDIVLDGLNKHIAKTTGFETVSFIEKEFEKHEVLHDVLNERNNYVIAEMVCPVIEDDDISTSIKNVSLENEDDKKTFSSISDEFELTHAKIINKSIFIKQKPDRTFTILTEKGLRTSYSHLVYDEWIDTKYGGNFVVKGFIGKWLNENPCQRRYDDLTCNPYCGLNDPYQSSNLFNIWSPFDGEFVKPHPFIWKQDGLNIMLKHISILCNHQKEVSDYLIKWIGQMIQYPKVKTICPTLISNEGAGKGTLLLLMRKMLGDTKVMETTTPSRDVWGQFNNSMANSFLVVLNELSKKDTLDAEGIIKGLITDGKMTINTKGVSSYDINSYHRFVITTNKEEPIVSKKGDRRNLIIRSSDEKCGDKEYFKQIYELFNDDDIIKTCYEYFKHIPDLDQFGSLPIPITEYQEDIKEASICPIEVWFKHYVIENKDYINNDGLNSICVSSSTLFEDFMCYKKKNDVNYNVNNIAFCLRLKRLGINGTSIKRTNKGKVWIFDFEKLKIVYQLGLLINIQLDGEDDVEDE
jgi:hypothetical protein